MKIRLIKCGRECVHDSLILKMALNLLHENAD